MNIKVRSLWNTFREKEGEISFESLKKLELPDWSKSTDDFSQKSPKFTQRYDASLDPLDALFPLISISVRFDVLVSSILIFLKLRLISVSLRSIAFIVIISPKVRNFNFSELQLHPIVPIVSIVQAVGSANIVSLRKREKRRERETERKKADIFQLLESG